MTRRRVRDTRCWRAWATESSSRSCASRSRRSQKDATTLVPVRGFSFISSSLTSSCSIISLTFSLSHLHCFFSFVNITRFFPMSFLCIVTSPLPLPYVIRTPCSCYALLRNLTHHSSLGICFPSHDHHSLLFSCNYLAIHISRLITFLNPIA